MKDRFTIHSIDESAYIMYRKASFLFLKKGLAMSEEMC